MLSSGKSTSAIDAAMCQCYSLWLIDNFGAYFLLAWHFSRYWTDCLHGFGTACFREKSANLASTPTKSKPCIGCETRFPSLAAVNCRNFDRVFMPRQLT